MKKNAANPGATPCVYVSVKDVDGLHERAKAAGATFVKNPFDTEWGSRDFHMKDPEGRVWFFGTFLSCQESSYYTLLQPMNSTIGHGWCLEETVQCIRWAACMCIYCQATNPHRSSRPVLPSRHHTQSALERSRFKTSNACQVAQMCV